MCEIPVAGSFRSFVYFLIRNQLVIKFIRKTVYYFPGLEENLRVLNYYIKKKIIFNQNQMHNKIDIECSKNRQLNGCEHRILFDVSELALRDVHTGVQRVVRGLLGELLLNPPSGFCVRAVRADAEGRLLYANKFMAAFLGHDMSEARDETVEIAVGDIFFSADLYMHCPFGTLQTLQSRGGRLVFTVHDLFGLTLRNMLPKSYQLAFADWLRGVLLTADGVVCVSRSVADELYDWLNEHSGFRNAPLPVSWFHLGADLESSKPTEGISSTNEDVLRSINARSTLLMVGTIEPRKGHAQALDALETLWAQGEDINLVIVGKEGWRGHDLARRLRRHPERDRRIYWLERASDDLLLRLYAQSTALLAASFAEGFGLPLIEAAYHGLPIIARDMPVFREVAGDHAFYFPNDTNPQHLADAILHWLVLHAEGRAPQSRNMPYLSWRESAAQLVALLTEEHEPYRLWTPPSS